VLPLELKAWEGREIPRHNTEIPCPGGFRAVFAVSIIIIIIKKIDIRIFQNNCTESLTMKAKHFFLFPFLFNIV